MLSITNQKIYQFWPERINWKVAAVSDIMCRTLKHIRTTRSWSRVTLLWWKSTTHLISMIRKFNQSNIRAQMLAVMLIAHLPVGVTQHQFDSVHRQMICKWLCCRQLRTTNVAKKEWMWRTRKFVLIRGSCKARVVWVFHTFDPCNSIEKKIVLSVD